MKRLIHAAVALLTLACGWAAAGPSPAPVRAEIDALLARLSSSGCQFNRNGDWHAGAEARGHLLRKLEAVERRTTLTSTEQFIELAASRSSMSGKAYRVRCQGGPVVESQAWLTRQLADVRKGAGAAASGASAPAGGRKP